MEKFSVRLIIERMKEVLGKENDKALIEELGVAQTTFSNWKNRNNMPIDMILTFAQNHNLSLDWLIYGKDKTQALKATEKMLLTAFNELDDKQQLQAVVFVGNLAQGGGASGQGGSTMTVNNSQADNIANGSITIGR
ncbi:MAG: helix-turn-helix domain-containing protein [Haemophilus parahaemolyticus]|uniref:helix-turn-helix domain-containing protein n=1 Tax=Haemophilus parahaemolyticus TaxID=735 RepID=UPI0026EA56E8|nr:helix-turn-helix domain-containing protein [Haemophilus parahaemolyticus]MBS6009694.1 helix-turn-helix domain-containing protein [Haemophilus parahaemolyticus]